MQYSHCGWPTPLPRDEIIDAVDASKILSYYAYLSTTKEKTVSMEEFMKKSSK